MQSEQQGPVKDMPCPLPKSTGSQMLLSNVTKVLCLSFTTEGSFSLSLSVGTKTALSQFGGSSEADRGTRILETDSENQY